VWLIGQTATPTFVVLSPQGKAIAASAGFQAPPAFAAFLDDPGA
jgi:hypothetical protein